MMKDKQIFPKPALPYGAYSAIARKLARSGRRPCTPIEVWSAIHQSEDLEVMRLAAEYLERREELELEVGGATSPRESESMDRRRVRSLAKTAI